MKKIFIVLVIVLAAGAAYFLLKKNPTQEVKPVVTADYKNIAYTIDGESFLLVNGVAEKESAPGAPGEKSAEKSTVRYFGNEAKADWNGDGKDDTAFIINEETGGTGVFYYVVVALTTPDGLVGTNAVFLGDRIAPQTTQAGVGSQIIVNYADRAPGEPMVATPSVGVSKFFKISGTTLQEISRD